METKPSNAAAPGRDREQWAAIAVASGGLLAFLCAGFSFGLFRETLHYNCSWGIGGEWGENGTWSCGDGIGYLVVAVGLGGMSALLLLIGLFTAIARPSPRRTIAFLALATVSLGWVAWWTFYAATVYTGPRPEGETGSGVWVMTVLPAVSLCTLGLLLGIVGSVTQRRRSATVLYSGIGLILIGTTLQPGIGVATLVSAGMLAAAKTSQSSAR